MPPKNNPDSAPPKNDATQQHFSEAAGESAANLALQPTANPTSILRSPSANPTNASPTGSPVVTFFTDAHPSSSAAEGPRREPTFQSVGGGKFVPTRESGAGGSRASGRYYPSRASGVQQQQQKFYKQKGAKTLDLASVVVDHNAPNADTSSMATVSPRRVAAYTTNPDGIVGAINHAGGDNTTASVAFPQEDEDVLYSDDSVESDFDYDEDGNPRTYYKKPRRTVAFDPFATGGGGGEGTRESAAPRDSTYAPGGQGGERDSLLHGGGGAGGTHASMAGTTTGSMYGSRGVPLNMFYDALAASRASVKMNRQRILSTMTEHQRSPSVMGLPENLRGLGREIHKLPTEELLYISSMVSRKAHREAFSVLQYTGKAWYLPSVRKCREDEGEARWDWPRYRFEEGLILTINGRVLTIQPRGYIVRLVILVLFWLILWSMLPQKLTEPGGEIFDPLVVFVLAAIVGGFICRLLQIPPLVGVLWVAIIFNNVPKYHELTHGITNEVKTVASRMGLTVVLLRAGFSTSWKAMRPLWKNVAALSVVALALEGGVHTAMTYYLFNFKSWTFASLQGFMCAVPSAAIMVPTALLLQGDGLSKTKGPLPLVLSTVGVETVLGVWVSSFISGIAVGGATITMSLIMGPVQIVGGIVLAIILAFLFVHAVKWITKEAKRMPNGEYSQDHLNSVTQFALILFLITAFAVIFFGYKNNLAGGSCVTVMLFSTLVAHLWLKDGDPELVEQKKALGGAICSVWELAVMPFLFSMTGTKVNLKVLFSASVFPKGLLLWVASVAVRMVIVFFSTMGLGFSLKEKIYSCGAWMAKATVQSALAGVALTAVQGKLDGFDKEADPAGYLKLLDDKEMAETVQNIAILFVLLSAPTAAVWMIKLGPKVLPKED